MSQCNCCCVLITRRYPLDVVKRRMQLAGTTQNRKKFWYKPIINFSDYVKYILHLQIPWLYIIALNRYCDIIFLQAITYHKLYENNQLAYTLWLWFIPRGSCCALLCVSFNSCCLQTLKTVYTEDGVRRGLYRGLSINYLRVVPQVSVMFGVYELSRQLLTTAQTQSSIIVY